MMKTMTAGIAEDGDRCSMTDRQCGNAIHHGGNTSAVS
jgi:hypothetical protein